MKKIVLIFLMVMPLNAQVLITTDPCLDNRYLELKEKRDKGRLTESEKGVYSAKRKACLDFRAPTNVAQEMRSFRNAYNIWNSIWLGLAFIAGLIVAASK